MKKQRTSLAVKLIISFVITSIIPIILINLFSYYNISDIVKENNNDLMKYNLSRTKTAIDISVQSYEDVLYQIYSDDMVVDLINKINQGQELVVSKNQLRRTLRGYFYAKDYIKDISVITENGTLVFYDSITGSTTRNSWIPALNLGQQELYDQIMKYKKTYVIPTGKAEKSANGENYLFHLGHRVVDFRKQNHEIGAVVISIDEKMLYEICTGEEETTAYSFIVDQAGTIISFRDKALLGTKIARDPDKPIDSYLKFAQHQNIFQEAAVTVDYTYDDKLGWDIVNVSNQNETLGRIRQQQRLTFTILSILLVVLGVIINFLIRGLTSSIKSVVSVMQSAGEGKLHARVEMDEKMPSEVEVIASQYNRTMDQLLEALEKEKQLDRKRKDAEIAALEAQLNPHFLYNTLDTINWIAIGKREFEISRAITALAVILRYGIDHSNGIVTVREEYEWLKQYLLLQQTRLKEEFESQVDIPAEIMDVRVHKLLIQPFVENCFVHGFEGVHRKHILKISMKLDDQGFLSTVIEDNGKGMPAQMVEDANHYRFADTRDKNQIGLKNAFYRIGLYYGERADIKIESREGEYTKVCMIIPVSAEKGESKDESGSR